jgi:tetratricopeptide (TPR) repeat protein
MSPTSASSPAIRPLLARPAFWFCAIGLLLAFGLLVQPLADPDVFIHLRDGRYLLAHHFQAGTEPFAYTVPGKPFETAEWLFRVGAYLVWRAGGFNLLILLKSLLMTAAVFLLGVLAYRRWRNLGAVALLLALALLAPAARLFPERPYVFTYLLLPLVLVWLDDFRRAAPDAGPRARRRLWLIPVLIVPWANLHPGFMVVFGFLGAECVQYGLEAVRSRTAEAWGRVRVLALVTAAAVIAGAVNSMGFGLYTFTLGAMNSREFMHFILEWGPPRLGSEPVFFLLLGLAWTAALVNWRRLQIRDLLPLLAFSYLAVNSYRNIPLFLIAALPPLAGNLYDLKNRYVPRAQLASAWRTRSLWAGTAAGLALLALTAITGWSFRLGLLPGFYPERGLPWLDRHQFQGNLLTHDIWGGYTGWITEGRLKVFMDGRLPTFGEALYRDYRKMIWGDAAACLPLLNRYRVEGILVSPKNDLKLYQQLWQSGDWTLVYWDDECLAYVRRQGANQALADRYGYYALDPKRVPYYDPARAEQALAEAQRAQSEAPQSFLPYFFTGDLNLRLGRAAPSREALLQAIHLAPAHAASYLDLGLLARQTRRPEEAERCFRRVIALRDDRTLYALACQQLGALLAENPARRAEAKHWAQAALRTLPDFPAARQLLADLER